MKIINFDIDRRYRKAIIYFIYDNNGYLIYIGSTIDLAHRFYNHKCDYYKYIKNNNLTKYYYQYMIDNNLQFEDLMYKTQIYSCKSIIKKEAEKELSREEGRLQYFFKPICNINIAGRTREEWYKEYISLNKEKIRNQKKIYEIKNKVKLAVKKKIYRENNKEKLKEKAKLYRENNKDKLKEYRQKNKEIISKHKGIFINIPFFIFYSPLTTCYSLNVDQA